MVKMERAKRRRLVILGATGSIGRSALKVLSETSAFDVVAVAGGSNGKELARIARACRAKFAAVADPTAYRDLTEGLVGSGVKAASGKDAVREAAVYPSDLVLAAISGTAGLAPTYAALEAGRTIALANKECLVCAGDLFMRRARENGISVLPVDSEHNSVFQALSGLDASKVEKMTLTASGGPFRLWTKEQIDAATPEQALNHPNYVMGRKITVDSAGLMNKGLELIEARYIFDIAPHKLDVLVHPQQIVHGLVSFADCSVVAGLALPDMATPIAHCFAYPDRIVLKAPALDLAKIGNLTFERPDFERFPALKLAMETMMAGQGLTLVLNAANEIAVKAFLDRRIGFPDIVKVVSEACDRAIADGTAHVPASIEEALAMDQTVRLKVAETIIN